MGVLWGFSRNCSSGRGLLSLLGVLEFERFEDALESSLRDSETPRSESNFAFSAFFAASKLDNTFVY